MQLAVGTSGYSYKEWKGAFYPVKIQASDMLAFYAERFASVEINNTFYRMPDEAVLADWSATVPERFSFAFKVPRRISHIKRLREATPDLDEFVRRTAVLQGKLGPLLVQLPPFMKADVGLLQEFVASLPSEPSFAFEFRHASWQCEPVYAALRSRGAMLCVAETDEAQTPLIATSKHGYLRLRAVSYDDARLSAWAERIAAQPWERAYVYFKHEDEALGPQFARRFLELWDAVQGTRRS